LIHSPFHDKDLKELWKQMEELVDLKLVKSIGVSNFRINDLKEILSTCKIKPVVNQIEFNPYLQ
jgi:diketogulonate reductase-like aldo/keto reductase